MVEVSQPGGGRELFPEPGQEEVARRLETGGVLRFDCPMCARVQKVRLADSLCESCGARLRVFDRVDAARRALATARERSAQLRALGGGLYVVATL